MWDSFFLVFLVGFLSLYLPGYILARAVLSRIPAFVCAPLITVVEMNVVVVAYSELGVFCSAVSVLTPLMVAGVVAFAARQIACGTRFAPFTWGLSERVSFSGRDVSHFGSVCLVGYIVFSCLVAAYVVLSGLESPDSFVQEYDNINHLGLIQTHVLTGDWSPFSNSLYAGSGDATPFASEAQGFYPSAWIIVSTLLSQAMGVSPAFAENATTILFVGIVSPSSMYALMRTVFVSKPGIVVLGAFCVPAFSAFPWRMMLFGPLYPNVAAYTMVAATAFAFLVVLKEGERRSSRIWAAALFVVGLAALVFTQPNAVFVVALFLVPYCVYRIALRTNGLDLPGAKGVVARWAAPLGFLVFAALVWAIALHLPFFEGVLSEWWSASSTKQQALANVVTLSFSSDVAQPALACLVVLGVAYALLRRKYLWVVVSYLIFCFLFWLDSSTEWALKLWLTGFWYTDKFRLAAAAAIFGPMIAAMGFYALTEVVAKASRTVARQGDLIAPRVISALSVVAVVLIVFYPNVVFVGFGEVPTAFGKLCNDFEGETSSAPPSIYDAEERAFVQRVKDTVPQDAIVLNLPHDGSAFAYAQDGLGLYYRNARGYDPSVEKPESRIIRERLDEYASDDEVKDAVKTIGAQYVLLLDVGGPSDTSPFLFTYEEPNWSGFTHIDENTSGFQVVLAEGDMRLYRVVETQ